MAKKKTKKPCKTYTDCTLHSTNQEIEAAPLLGRISATGENEFTFEGDDKIFSRTAERKWYTKDVNKTYKRRVSKNIETREFKVTYTIDRDILERLDGRLAHNMANDLTEVLEKIILINISNK